MPATVKIVPRALVLKVRDEMRRRGYVAFSDDTIRNILAGENFHIPGYFDHHERAVSFVETFREV